MTTAFEGKAALVTGAGGGIGLAAAQAFSKAGACVILADRDEEKIGKAAEDLCAAGHNAIGITCDVTDTAQVEAMIERAVSTYGRLDAAFNNAGVNSEAAAFLETSDDEFERVMNVNVTVPTTLSAGEFSAISGVTDERHRVKELIRHPYIIPRAVVLDPAVAVHTPEWLWLSTGIRAVDHCVEGICSGEANPYGDAQALHGLSLLAHGLPRVKADPSDLAARLDCQTGSWLSMAPLASGVPMGASHGIGYVLGAVFDIPHGHTSCIMLPAVMHWNKPVNAERQAMVAAAMGHPGEDASDVLDAFIAGLGMPRSGEWYFIRGQNSCEDTREVSMSPRTFS